MQQLLNVVVARKSWTLSTWAKFRIEQLKVHKAGQQREILFVCARQCEAQLLAAHRQYSAV
jgi:hypothetical protein